MCDHKFNYMGLQYAHGANRIPGSGSVTRYYAHVFFCEKCLEKRAERVDGYQQTSYSTALDDSTPGDRKLIVPAHDLNYGYV